MKNQQQKHPKIVHNIIWRKWQKKKAYYEHQRMQKCEQYSAGNRFVTEPQRDREIQRERFGEWDQDDFRGNGGVVEKTTFGQFVRRVGMERSYVGDVGWVRVGQPRAYYVSCTKKRSKTVNALTPEQHTLHNGMIHSRASYANHRTKTQPIHQPQSKTPTATATAYTYTSSYTKPPTPIKTAPQSPQQKIFTKSNGFMHAVPRILRKRKSSGFEFRPWSGEKQSMVDFYVNINR